MATCMVWKKYPGAILATLLLTHILAHIDRNIPLGFSSSLIADLGLSNTQYGLLVGAVWVLSYAVMAVVTGTFADRFSRTRVIAAGLLVWSVCTAASGSAHSFGQLVATRKRAAKQRWSRQRSGSSPRSFRRVAAARRSDCSSSAFRSESASASCWPEP
jgi:MFS family permease